MSGSVVGGGQEAVKCGQRRVLVERARCDRSQLVFVKMPNHIGRGVGYLSEGAGHDTEIA